MVLPLVEAGPSLTRLPTLETPFLLLGCLFQPWGENFALSYFVLLCLAVLLEVCSSLKGDGGGVDAGEMARVEGRDCMRENLFFNK